MDFTQLIKNITPNIHQRLKQAIEIGKWPDGRVLTQEQKELSMQAVISYEYQHLLETDRVGYIDKGHKTQGDVCDNTEMPTEPKPIKWL